MRLAVAIGLLVGLMAPFAAVALVSLGYGRCIDSPKFLDPRPLAIAGSGIGLIAAGAIGLGAARQSRLSAAVLGLGVLVVAFALAGPPYNSCKEWEGLVRN